jgi:hypothetical protein
MQLELPMEVGCRCGRVRLAIDEPPLLESACHCRGCQKMTGSAFSTTLTVPESGLTITSGAVVVGGMHGEEADHMHCDWCKSWVFTRPRAALGFVNLRATMLDDASWFAPWLETQTAEKLTWAHTGAAKSYERFPEFTEYTQLVEEYRAARWGDPLGTEASSSAP